MQVVIDIQQVNVTSIEPYALVGQKQIHMRCAFQFQNQADN